MYALVGNADVPYVRIRLSMSASLVALSLLRMMSSEEREHAVSVSAVEMHDCVVKHHLHGLPFVTPHMLHGRRRHCSVVITGAFDAC